MMRISLSWSRILPNGYNNQISQSGISFYDNVIDEMLLNNIIPMISLFDDDMPYSLQQLGGWTNPIIVDIFVDYAKIAFSSFADRVMYRELNIYFIKHLSDLLNYRMIAHTYL